MPTPRPAATRKPLERLPGLAPWIGGKRHLAARIAQRVAGIPHHCYAEVFLGMGGVFFARRQRPRVEVINDRNGEVVNLFRVMQRHPDALRAQLRYQLSARRDFERLVKTDPGTLTDIERAARFMTIQRLNFGGKPRDRSFPARAVSSKAIDPTKLRRMLDAWHARLSRVTIECLDWREMLARYDRPATLFYLDPPYWGFEDLYGKQIFGRADFTEMAEMLDRLKGRFILSLNDLPEVRRIFSRFRIEDVPVTYSAVPGANRATRELLISNE